MKLILEMELDEEPLHAGDQIVDAINSLASFKNRLWNDREYPERQSDLILDSGEDDALIGNWRIEE